MAVFARGSACRTGHCRDEPDAAAGGGRSVYLRLSTRALEQPRRKLDSLRQGVIDGAYWLREPGPNCEVVIAYQGTVATEAIAAAGSLAEGRRDVGILAVTSADRLNAGWQAAQTARINGRTTQSHIARLLAPIARDCLLVTVIDGHPATLSWLGSVHGDRVAGLGVEHFGQTGTVADLCRHFGIDRNSILRVIAGLAPGGPPALCWGALTGSTANAAHCTADDFAALDRGSLIAVLAVGAIEQHGPHLPVSVDPAVPDGIVATTPPLVPDSWKGRTAVPFQVRLTAMHRSPGLLQIGGLTRITAFVRRPKYRVIVKNACMLIQIKMTLLKEAHGRRRHRWKCFPASLLHRWNRRVKSRAFRRYFLRRHFAKLRFR